MAYERVLLESRPDLVIFVGDVNSTIACTLAPTKISYNPTHSSGNQDPASRIVR